MLEVMITTALRKSTVRPWPSVRRPSSSTCSSTLNTSGCAFSISSNSTTVVRPAAHRLGELAALVVADVAGRRADQAGHACASPCTRDMSMRIIARSSSNRNSASARASSVLPTPVGPRNRNEPIGRFGIAEAGPPAPHGVGHRVDGVVLAHHALREPLLHPHQLLDLAPRAGASTGMPVHFATVAAMSSSLTSSRSIRPPLTLDGELASSSRQLAARTGSDAEAQLGRPVEIARALGLGHRLARRPRRPP